MDEFDGGGGEGHWRNIRRLGELDSVREPDIRLTLNACALHNLLQPWATGEGLGGVHAVEVMVDSYVVGVPIRLIDTVIRYTHRFSLVVEVVVRLLPLVKVCNVMSHEESCHPGSPLQ